MTCSHGDNIRQGKPGMPCGDDRWCQEQADHEGPHTGQHVRCLCGTVRRGKDWHPQEWWTARTPRRKAAIR